MKYKPDELFRSTAPYYARYRAGYPGEFFAYLAARFRLDGTQHVLDLGCGTGQISLPLAPHVARVYAVDPERTMLEEGERLACQRGIGNITWTHGDSYHLSALDLPDLTLVAMGASFHWMDRPAVLRDLDALIIADGAVVIASGGHPPGQSPPPWADAIAAIRRKYLGPDRRAGSGTYTHPDERHADVLRRSPFPVVETQTWDWTLDRDIDSIIGLQFSFSYSAPAQFRSSRQRTAFEDELRRELARHAPDGVFAEHIRTEAITGTRT